MASLLERMNIDSVPNSGPNRKSSAPRGRYSPYSRPPPGDPDAPWSHDLYEQANPSLSQRLSSATAPSTPRPSLHRPTINTLASKALRAATAPVESNSAGTQLTIKGASTLTHGNVVQVTGLVPGTTAEDVSAIFKQCGPILSSRLLPPSLHPSSTNDSPVIRITYKTPQAARDAVAKFDKQPADGRVLSVTIVGGASTALAGRLAGEGAGGVLDLVEQSQGVDFLMQDATGTSTVSKMRSDSLMQSDHRAQVLIAPPGANLADYTQSTAQVNSTPKTGARARGAGRGRSGRARAEL